MIPASQGEPGCQQAEALQRVPDPEMPGCDCRAQPEIQNVGNAGGHRRSLYAHHRHQQQIAGHIEHRNCAHDPEMTGRMPRDCQPDHRGFGHRGHDGRKQQEGEHSRCLAVGFTQKQHKHILQQQDRSAEQKHDHRHDPVHVAVQRPVLRIPFIVFNGPGQPQGLKGGGDHRKQIHDALGAGIDPHLVVIRKPADAEPVRGLKDQKHGTGRHQGKAVGQQMPGLDGLRRRRSGFEPESPFCIQFRGHAGCHGRQRGADHDRETVSGKQPHPGQHQNHIERFVQHRHGGIERGAVFQPQHQHAHPVQRPDKQGQNEAQDQEPVLFTDQPRQQGAGDQQTQKQRHGKAEGQDPALDGRRLSRIKKPDERLVQAQRADHDRQRTPGVENRDLSIHRRIRQTGDYGHGQRRNEHHDQGPAGQ